jgi:hypothetical protein
MRSDSELLEAISVGGVAAITEEEAMNLAKGKARSFADGYSNTARQLTEALKSATPGLQVTLQSEIKSAEKRRDDWLTTADDPARLREWAKVLRGG